MRLLLLILRNMKSEREKVNKKTTNNKSGTNTKTGCREVGVKNYQHAYGILAVTSHYVPDKQLISTGHI